MKLLKHVWIAFICAGVICQQLYGMESIQEIDYSATVMLKCLIFVTSYGLYLATTKIIYPYLSKNSHRFIFSAPNGIFNFRVIPSVHTLANVIDNVAYRIQADPAAVVIRVAENDALIETFEELVHALNHRNTFEVGIRQPDNTVNFDGAIPY